MTTVEVPIVQFSDEVEVSLEASLEAYRRRLRNEVASDESADDTFSASEPNVVEELAQAIGIHYDDGEELRFGEKELLRDVHRWELDPASAEDYRERRESQS